MKSIIYLPKHDHSYSYDSILLSFCSNSPC